MPRPNIDDIIRSRGAWDIIPRIARLTERIELFESKPTSRARRKIIAGSKERREFLQNMLAELEAEVTIQEIETVVNTPANPDKFSIDLVPSDGSDIFDRINFTISNSEEDDTYVGNEPLLMEITGTKKTRKGRLRRKTEYSTLANGEYWNSGPDQIISAGGEILENFKGFDNFTVTVAKATEEGLSGFHQGDILATQTFNVSDFIS